MKRVAPPVQLLLFIVGFSFLMLAVKQWDFQWDLTPNQRYSFSESTIAFVRQIDSPTKIDVLLGGALPSNYKRLRSELTIILEQLRLHNAFIHYEFVDPFEDAADKETLLEELYQFGLIPEIEMEQENQSTEQTLVVPWMIINKDQKSVKISLLQKNLGDTAEQRIEQSIQLLEYHIFDGIYQLGLRQKKQIAVITSHNTSSDIALMSLLQSLLPYYKLAPFDLKAFPDNPAKTLENLKRFDLLLISNPRKKFTNEEKFMFDQYTRQGGSSIFLIDPVTVARDSLFSLQGEAVVYPITHELDELFFKYGVRLNKNIVKDLYSAPIVLAQGENAQSDYRPYPWVYHPLIEPNKDHPVGNGIGSVFHRFVSSIDTLKSSLKKTVLLESSTRSKVELPPFLISLKEATEPIKPSLFTDRNKITGVLLEGQFPSLFENRIAPFEWSQNKTAQLAKIAIFSDGNLAENQVSKGQPLELGYDKWTNNLYSNKAFLHNTIHYLMNEDQRLSIRSKTIQLAFLDPQKIKENGATIRLLAMLIPLFILGLMGSVFWGLRHRKYRR